MTTKRFRFGVVAAFARTGDEWAEKARQAESRGYDTLVIPDNVAHTLAPIPALAWAAAATKTLRVGAYVFANDYRNPVLLAKDAATLDLLTGGRFEFGIGAGRPSAAGDNAMLGLPFDSGGARVTKLAESLALIKPLLAGEQVSANGPHYTAAGAQISPGPAQRPHPPILIAGSGKRLLALAAREADIVALGVAPDQGEAGVLERIGWLRDAAGDRFDAIELNINLMAIGDRVPRWIASQYGADAATWAASGAVPAIGGSVEEMCTQLEQRRERLGLSYFVVADELMDALAPVVERLAGR